MKMLPTIMNYDKEILLFLEKQERPIDVEKVRKSVGISHWNAALSHLLKLVVEGQIEGTKTSRGWVFSAKRTNRSSSK